jgi:hypothetical protein
MKVIFPQLRCRWTRNAEKPGSQKFLLARKRFDSLAAMLAFFEVKDRLRISFTVQESHQKPVFRFRRGDTSHHYLS